MDARTPNRMPFHRLPVFPVLLAQLAILLLAAAVFFGWRSATGGYSAFCGGLIAWLPNMYFAHKAFRFGGARAAQSIVRSFYAGEAGKLILTAALFALAFAGVRPLDAAALFAAFLLVQSVNWFAPLLVKRRSTKT
jgi:ATP synthase protein I